MAVCDELEAQLNTATGTRRTLLEATLQEALAPITSEEPTSNLVCLQNV